MRKLLLILFLLLMHLEARATVAHVASGQGACNSTGDSGNMPTSCPAATNTFSYTATGANHAITFAVGCSATTAVTSATLTATGWTITRLTSATPPGSTANGWFALFGAIAPNTTAATFTVTWSASCNGFMSDLIDEFSGNDVTGGTTTFDAANSGTGTGSCSITVTPANANDGLMGACLDSVTAVGSGFTKGADDTQQDWSEWKILTGGSGVGQTVNFTGSGNWVAVGASIRPVSSLVVTRGKAVIF